jgi:transposase
MLFIGYFEGISSQRGIAWRCADSRSLQSFLGIDPAQRTPEHSSLSVIRSRLPLEVHEQVFAMVLTIASQTGILKGRTLAVDATTLEANAAMKSIVRRDTGDNWNEYLRELAKEAGIEEPTDEDLDPQLERPWVPPRPPRCIVPKSLAQPWASNFPSWRHTL